MCHLLTVLITEYTVRIVLFGGIVLGMTAGMLGAFVFVRQQSLLGDAIAHASLPGIIAIFLLTGTTWQPLLMVGGMIAGSIGILLMHFVLHTTKLKKDAVLGIILSVFFGIGLILLTIVQKYHVAQQGILNKYLFGNLATLLHTDVLWLLGMCTIVLVGLCAVAKECTMIAFDVEYTKTQGYSLHLLEAIMHLFLLITIGVGLHMVGVILMSTLLIAPAAAARQCTRTMSRFVLVSGLCGACAVVIGILISSMVSHMPTGPCIVLVATSMVIISLVGRLKRVRHARYTETRGI